jgi:hypothetical protein
MLWASLSEPSLINNMRDREVLKLMKGLPWSCLLDFFEDNHPTPSGVYTLDSIAMMFNTTREYVRILLEGLDGKTSRRQGGLLPLLRKGKLKDKTGTVVVKFEIAC